MRSRVWCATPKQCDGCHIGRVSNRWSKSCLVCACHFSTYPFVIPHRNSTLHSFPTPPTPFSTHSSFVTMFASPTDCSMRSNLGWIGVIFFTTAVISIGCAAHVHAESVAAVTMDPCSPVSEWGDWLPCSRLGYQIRFRSAPPCAPFFDLRSCWAADPAYAHWFHEGDIWPGHASAILGSFRRECTASERATSCATSDDDVCMIRCLDGDSHCTRLASCGGRGYYRTDDKRFEITEPTRLDPPIPLHATVGALDNEELDPLYLEFCGPGVISATIITSPTTNEQTVQAGSCVCQPGWVPLNRGSVLPAWPCGLETTLVPCSLSQLEHYRLYGMDAVFGSQCQVYTPLSSSVQRYYSPVTRPLFGSSVLITSPTATVVSQVCGEYTEPAAPIQGIACTFSFTPGTAPACVASTGGSVSPVCVCRQGSSTDGRGRPCGRNYRVRALQSSLASICGPGTLRAYGRCRGSVDSDITCSIVHACECADESSSNALGHEIIVAADSTNYGDAGVMASRARIDIPYPDDNDAWRTSASHPRLFRQCGCSSNPSATGLVGTCARRLVGCGARSVCGAFAESVTALCVVPGRCIPAWYGCTCDTNGVAVNTTQLVGGVIPPELQCDARLDACKPSEVDTMCPPSRDTAGAITGQFKSCNVTRHRGTTTLVEGSCTGFQFRVRACRTTEERLRSCGSSRAECSWDGVGDQPLPLESRACVCEIGMVWNPTINSCAPIDTGYMECTEAEREFCPVSTITLHAPPTRCRARVVAAHNAFDYASTPYVESLVTLIAVNPASNPLLDADANSKIQQAVAAITLSSSHQGAPTVGTLAMLRERSQLGNTRPSHIRIPECYCFGDRGLVSSSIVPSWVSKLGVFAQIHADRRAAGTGSTPITDPLVLNTKHTCATSVANRARASVLETINSWLYGRCPSTHGVACNGHGSCRSMPPDLLNEFARDARVYASVYLAHNHSVQPLPPVVFQSTPPHPYQSMLGGESPTSAVQQLVFFLYSRAESVGAVNATWVQLLPGFRDDSFPLPYRARDTGHPDFRSTPRNWHHTYLSDAFANADADEHVVMFQVDCDIAIDLPVNGVRDANRKGNGLRRFLWDNLVKRGVRLFETNADFTSASIPGQTDGRVGLERFMYGADVVAGDATVDTIGDQCANRIRSGIAMDREPFVGFESPCREWGHSLTGLSNTGFERTGGRQPPPTSASGVPPIASGLNYNRLIFDRYKTQCAHATNVECQHGVCVNSVNTDFSMDERVAKSQSLMTRNSIRCQFPQTYRSGDTFGDTHCDTLVDYPMFCTCSLTNPSSIHEYWDPRGSSAKWSNVVEGQDPWLLAATYQPGDVGRRSFASASCSNRPFGDCFASSERGCTLHSKARGYRNADRVYGLEESDVVPCINSDRTERGWSTYRSLRSLNPDVCFINTRAPGWNRYSTTGGVTPEFSYTYEIANFIREDYPSAYNTLLLQPFEAYRCRNPYTDAALLKVLANTPGGFRLAIADTFLPSRGARPRFNEELFRVAVGLLRTHFRPNWCTTDPVAIDLSADMVTNVLMVRRPDERTNPTVRRQVTDAVHDLYTSMIFDERVENQFRVHQTSIILPSQCTDQELLDADSGSSCDRCPHNYESVGAVTGRLTGMTVWWYLAGNYSHTFGGFGASFPVFTVMDYVGADMSRAATNRTRLEQLYKSTRYSVGATPESILDGSTAPLKDGRARSMYKVARGPNGSVRRHLLPGLIAMWDPKWSIAPNGFGSTRIARFHPYHLALNDLWMFPYARSAVDEDYILSYDPPQLDQCAPRRTDLYSKPRPVPFNSNQQSTWREMSAFGSRRGTLFDWMSTPPVTSAQSRYHSFRATGGDERPEMCVASGKVGRYSLLPTGTVGARGLMQYATCECSAGFTTPTSDASDDAIGAPSVGRADASSGNHHACTARDMGVNSQFPMLPRYCLSRVVSESGVVSWVPSTDDQTACVYKNTTAASEYCVNGYWDSTVSRCVCTRGWTLSAIEDPFVARRCTVPTGGCLIDLSTLGTCNERGRVDPVLCACQCNLGTYGPTCLGGNPDIDGSTCGFGRGALNSTGSCVCARGSRGGWTGDSTCTTPQVYDTSYTSQCTANGGSLAYTPQCAPRTSNNQLAFSIAACSASQFLTCECPPHRFGAVCENTMCPVDSSGRECGGPGRGSCVFNSTSGTASCACVPSCETQLVSGTITPACTAAIASYTQGNVSALPMWTGCACDVNARVVCSQPGTVEQCGSIDRGVQMCTERVNSRWAEPGINSVSTIRACDCTRGASAGLSGQFCTGTVCPVAGGRPCNGRRCITTTSSFTLNVTVECDCAPRISSDPLLIGGSCENDATAACGVSAGPGTLIRSCSNRGTCGCAPNPTSGIVECGCTCSPAYTGAKCETSICPVDCLFGECTPGVLSAPAQCMCRPAYRRDPSGACSLNACLHGATPNADGSACVCPNPNMSYERRCLNPDCPRDSGNQESCGRALPFDEYISGGVVGDTLLKQCGADGTCACAVGYYVRSSPLSPCAWYCDATNTLSVSSGGACSCAYGWRGLRCNTRICHETATIADGGVCTCDPPTRMVMSTGECQLPACTNGQLLPDGTCRCFAGFTGVDCASSVCVNGAPWDARAGRCVCRLPFTGTFCEATDCGVLATFNPDTRKCECRAGWSGPGCTIRVCEGNYRPDVNFPSECVCDPQFTGPNCTPPPCSNGESVCVGGRCACFCSLGFVNDPVTGDCTVSVCGTFGTPSQTAVCSCPPPFAFFPTRIPRCQRPCSVIGTASYNVTTGVCTCQSGYSGAECSVGSPSGATGGGGGTTGVTGGGATGTGGGGGTATDPEETSSDSIPYIGLGVVGGLVVVVAVGGWALNKLFPALFS